MTLLLRTLEESQIVFLLHLETGYSPSGRSRTDTGTLLPRSRSGRRSSSGQGPNFRCVGGPGGLCLGLSSPTLSLSPLPVIASPNKEHPLHRHTPSLSGPDSPTDPRTPSRKSGRTPQTGREKVYKDGLRCVKRSVLPEGMMRTEEYGRDRGWSYHWVPRIQRPPESAGKRRDPRFLSSPGTTPIVGVVVTVLLFPPEEWYGSLGATDPDTVSR